MKKRYFPKIFSIIVFTLIFLFGAASPTIALCNPVPAPPATPSCPCPACFPGALIGCYDGSYFCCQTGLESPCQSSVWYCRHDRCTDLCKNAGLTYVGIFMACMDFGGFLNRIIQWGLALAAVAAVVRIIVGGIQYMFAHGDPKAIADANETITYAVVGLLIIIAAWLVMRVLSGQLDPRWRIWLGMPG